MLVKCEMRPVQDILHHLGVDRTGRIQMFVTNEVNRRITKYMPFRSGALATKLKHVASPTTIEVLAPYARYQYEGKRMVNAKTGNGPALIPGVGYRYRLGTVLKPTEDPLKYDTAKNPLAGPHWDRRMMAAEGKQIAATVQRFAGGTK